MAGLSDALVFRVGMDMSVVERELNKMPKKAAASAKRIAAALAVVAAAAAGAGSAIASIAQQAIETGKEFETLSTRLSTLMGSAAAGHQRMAEIFRFASTTPFELDEIVEAEVNLRALGVEAETVLPMILDFAGAMGTDLPQAAVEVGRAMQFGAGAVETIAGRALRAQVEMRTGTDALKMSVGEFRRELVTTLTDPDGIFAGGTASLASTFEGMVSNLEDSWTGFKMQIAQSGLFEGAKGGLREMLVLLDENRGKIATLAAEIGINLLASLMMVVQTIGMLVDWTTQFQLGWAAVKGTVAEVARTATKGVSVLWDFLRPIYALFALVNPIAAAGVEIVDNLDAKVQRVTATFNDMAEGSARDMYRLANNLGVGAAAAERLNSAMDAARSKGTESPYLDIAGPRTPASGASASPLGGKGEIDEIASALSSLRNMEASAIMGTLGAEQALRMEAEQRISAIEEIASEYASSAEVQIQAAESVHAVQAKLTLDLAELSKRAEEERRADIRRTQDAMLAGGANVLMGISEIAGLAADAQSKHSAKAARRLLVFQKAAAITAAVIQGAVAVVRAFADTGPIVGAVTAAGVAAMTAAQVASISSQEIPSYVSGGIMDAAPTVTRSTHQLAYIEPGRESAILNEGASRAGFADAVNQANRREGGGGQTVVIQPDRHFGRGWVEPARAGGVVRQQARRLSGYGRHTGRRGY